MKHMIRKPMIPILLLALMVFGTSFLGIFHAQIAEGREQVERLYNDTRITMELIPEGGWAQLNMKTHKTLLIEAMPEVTETLSVMECWYTLEDWQTSDKEVQIYESWSGTMEYIETDTGVIHSTNNIGWLTEYWNMTVTWHENWSPDSFTVTEGTVPCLVRQQWLDEQGLAPGDSFAISPCRSYDEVLLGAPRIQMVVAGVYSEDFTKTVESSILVPEESFMGEPKILYNSFMMGLCFYRTYALRIDPAYNREFVRIEDELEGILYDLDGYSFVSVARNLEKAARPLEQRLQMQEFLVMPLSVLLMVAAVVVAVLLGLGFSNEVFLRLMWGEKRSLVFAKLAGMVCLWLAVCVIAACGAVCVTAGTQWLRWAAEYAGTTAGLCCVAAAVPMAGFSCRNLVKFYQSKEVD